MITWASASVAALRSGRRVVIFPTGHSMHPRVRSEQRCEIEPITAGRAEIKIRDVVLCRVRGRDYLHLVVDKIGGRFLIGNNRGGLNGWISAAVELCGPHHILRPRSYQYSS